jgi:signal transduction histidine kinase
MQGSRLKRGSVGSPLSGIEVWIGLAVVAVVGCFVASTVIADRPVAGVVAWSREVSDVELPCVIELSRMRSELHDLEAGSAHRQRSPPQEVVRVASLLRRLEASERRGAGVVPVEREQALWIRARDELGALLTEVDAPSDERSSLGRESERSPVHARLLAVDAALEAVAAFESERGHRAQSDAEAAHSRMQTIAYGLDGLSALVAGILATLTIRLHRRNRRAMEGRASELETFAVRVAHDIRSPLTPALYALQRIQVRLAPDDPARGLVERGLRSIQTIDRTVEGLLAFASAWTAPARTQASSVCDVVGAVVAEYYDAAAAKGIAVVVERTDLVRAACGAGVLASILGNLVSNAIKYMGASDARRVVVRAVAGETRVRLEVEDTGPGLPEGTAEQIFDPYVRVDRSTPGLGLGLATVRRLAVAHGGSVGVLAAKPHGCLFWVELPIALPDPEKRSAVPR